jgi:hypothetical protein
MVKALYARARLSLEADLAKLNGGAAIGAEPAAVDYMLRHYTPTARPTVPLVAIQAVGDGLTSPSLQGSYAKAAGDRVKSLWVEQTGHCSFKPEVVLAGVDYLTQRLESGSWPAVPELFVRHVPPPMLRPCFRGRSCR